MKRTSLVPILLAGTMFALSACKVGNMPLQTPGENQPLTVLATTSFLADIAQNVAGERLTIRSLVPAGIDPHAFEATPQDVVSISDARVLITNGAGFEDWLTNLMENAGGEHLVIEASNGLEMRQPQAGELDELTNEHVDESAPAGKNPTGEDHAHEGDPHFWLDPLSVVHYVQNIRDGLISVDPAGEQTYRQNASIYIDQLTELDTWIRGEIAQIPPERRLLVTNHLSFGYYADRYGLRIVGTVIPSASSGSAPTAQQMGALIEHIRSAAAPAIFLETGSNPELAEQIAGETGVRVVIGLFTHSTSQPDGAAPTYLQMMRYNTRTIVEALH